MAFLSETTPILALMPVSSILRLHSNYLLLTYQDKKSSFNSTQFPASLPDLYFWNGTMYVYPVYVFNYVLVQLNSMEGVTSLKADVYSYWSQFIVCTKQTKETTNEEINIMQNYRFTLPLNKNGYAPSWANASFTFNLGDARLNINVDVGFLSHGWNFVFHSDGSLSLPTPPLLPNSDFNVCDHILFIYWCSNCCCRS